MNENDLIPSIDRDFQRRRIIVGVLFWGLLGLSIASACLLFQVESRVLPELIGDRALGILFAGIIEIAKPVLTLTGWFVVTAHAFRPPSSVKAVGVVVLPAVLWVLSGFCVFASVSLATNHPHLAEVRKADQEAIKAGFAELAEGLNAHAAAQLRDLDERAKREDEQYNVVLADDTGQFRREEQALRAQLDREMQTAADEPDFEKVQKLAERRDSQIAREREMLRRGFEANRMEAMRNRDAALAELNRRSRFRLMSDSSERKAELAANFERNLERLERDFENKDSALRTQTSAPPVPTSHAAFAKVLEGQLESLRKNFQNQHADTVVKQRAEKGEISNERQTVQGQLEKALAGASADFNARTEAAKTRDYSTDPRVQNPLLMDTLTTIRDGLGISISSPKFVAVFSLAVSLAVELILWVGTCWSAVMLSSMFTGMPFDPRTDAKKNWFANNSGSDGLSAASTGSIL